jgi:sugar-specific transcriptional regulator TrmB
MKLELFIDSLKLTAYEKDIVLFLCSVDDADAKAIYKKTSVPQGRIYGVLNELMHKGLISITPSKPKRYRIEDVKRSLRQYINIKQTELKEKSDAINDIELRSRTALSDKKTPSVSVYTGRDAHLQAIANIRDDAKKELLQVAPVFAGNFASRLSMQRALQRGVRVKILTVKITDKNRENIKNCIKYGGEIRTLENLEYIPLLISDSEEFLLGIQNQENMEERMMLSSRNAALLRLLKEYFFRLWRSAKPARL